MYRNTVIYYALIMLECRLSLTDASRIFGIEETKLYENLNLKNLEDLYFPIKYLLHETTIYQTDNRRGIFKASIYIRRLRRILKNPNKEERKEELNAFLTDLMGPDIRFVLAKELNARYTSEEKEKILKYRLKYAVSGLDLESGYHLDHEFLTKWEKELPNRELKERLAILRNYKMYNYKTYYRK